MASKCVSTLKKLYGFVVHLDEFSSRIRMLEKASKVGLKRNQTLPIPPSSVRALAPRGANGMSSSLKSRRRRILVVHPEAAMISRLRETLTVDLERETYEILAAADSHAAKLILASRHPDLVLLAIDEQHPATTFDFIHHIRALDADRHVGIITLGDAGVASLEAGADDFLANCDAPAELRARVRAALRLKSIHDELRSANHRLKLLSLTDDLTGLANMRCFSQKYAVMIRRCRAGELGFGIVMLDLDHFKSVNDTTNHLFGSFVISEIGRLFRKHAYLLGPEDIAARYGGDEFIVMLVGSPPEIEAKAERIRQLIAEQSFERDGNKAEITASVGVALVPPSYQGEAEQIIKLADMMLYHSKAGGRDRVCSTRLIPGRQPALQLMMTSRQRSHAEAITQTLKKQATS